MSSSSSATATSTDAQTWVYPAPGAATPPVAATSNFGPVHLFDKMVLQWSPSTTPNEIVYVCFSESLGIERQHPHINLVRPRLTIGGRTERMGHCRRSRTTLHIPIHQRGSTKERKRSGVLPLLLQSVSDGKYGRVPIQE